MELQVVLDSVHGDADLYVGSCALTEDEIPTKYLASAYSYSTEVVQIPLYEVQKEGEDSVCAFILGQAETTSYRLQFSLVCAQYETDFEGSRNVCMQDGSTTLLSGDKIGVETGGSTSTSTVDEDVWETVKWVINIFFQFLL